MSAIKHLFQPKSLHTQSPAAKSLSYLLLGIWGVVVIFPIYWLFVTSFKLPLDVNTGPFYLPFVDFQPNLHAWEYILVGDLSNDTIRPYINTIIVALTSASLALALGTAAAYALTRFAIDHKFPCVPIKAIPALNPGVVEHSHGESSCPTQRKPVDQ